jgi:thioredoxin-related protein
MRDPIRLILGLLAALVVAPVGAEGGGSGPDSFGPDLHEWQFDDRPGEHPFSHPEWFTPSFLDLREDLEAAQAEGKQGLIVYFGQANCPYCEALMDVNFTEPDIVARVREHFRVIALDIWGSRKVTDFQGRTLTERAYAVRAGTNFTPSLMFYTGEGTQAFRMRGYYPPYRFRAALDYVIGGFHEDERFRDYLARANPPPKFELEDMNFEPFFEKPPYILDRSRFPADVPLAVFFEQRACHACDILHTDPLGAEATRTLLQDYQAVQLDMWSDTKVITPDGTETTARAWADRLGLVYAPTVVLFSESGEEILRVDSVLRLYRLNGILRYVLEDGHEDYTSYARWRRGERLPEAERSSSPGQTSAREPEETDSEAPS